MRIEKIISGGQTGVDRAALDAALDSGIPHGGWCPRGRKAEDGCVPARYRLDETPAEKYAVRTAWNVRDADGTLILSRGRPDGGTALTQRCARDAGKPCLLVDLADGTVDPGAVAAWLTQNRIRILNIAGPRESKQPGIHAEAREFLERLLHIETRVRGEG